MCMPSPTPSGGRPGTPWMMRSRISGTGRRDAAHRHRSSSPSLAGGACAREVDREQGAVEALGVVRRTELRGRLWRVLGVEHRLVAHVILEQPTGVVLVALLSQHGICEGIHVRGV